MKPTSLVEEERVHRQVFVDPKIFELEMEHIFSKTWVYIGHESEVDVPGRYKSTTIGQQPVLLTRDEHGVLHAMINACRHRGVILADVDTDGKCRRFMCPYHGWSYDLTGRLVGMRMRDRQSPSFNDDEMGLIGIPRLETWRWVRLCKP